MSLWRTVLSMGGREADYNRPPLLGYVIVESHQMNKE